MTIGRTQMGTQLQGNRKMKKYQAGMGVTTSPRPKMRSKSVEEAAKKKALMDKIKKQQNMGMAQKENEMSTRNPMGPMPTPQPTIGEEMPRGKLKPPGMKKGGGVKMMGGGKVPGYKAGKTVRGYGMARGGKACKMR
tara:strand:+ start:403 stop:813 length:411 start_codon:yes stop_codon:yes gene_type:complete